MSDVNNSNTGFGNDTDNAGNGFAGDSEGTGKAGSGTGTRARANSGNGTKGGDGGADSGVSKSDGVERARRNRTAAVGVAGDDSGGDSGDGAGRRRGRPRKSGTGNGDSRRFAGTGQNAGAGSNAGAKTQEHLGDDSNRKVNEPKTGFKRGSGETSDKKFKKGYQPLMTTKEATQTVGGLFFATSLVLGSHWVLDEDEGKEIGEALGKMLEKFPVKISENPDLIEKLFLGFNLALVTTSAIAPRLRQTMDGKNDGILYKTAERQAERKQQQQPSNTNAAPPTGEGSAVNTSFDFAGNTQGFSFADKSDEVVG